VSLGGKLNFCFRLVSHLTANEAAAPVVFRFHSLLLDRASEGRLTQILALVQILGPLGRTNSSASSRTWINCKLVIGINIFLTTTIAF
jgi:hypothetical protein